MLPHTAVKASLPTPPRNRHRQKPDAAATKGFRDMADKFAVSMKGGVVPADVYDLAVRERDAYRKAHPAK